MAYRKVQPCAFVEVQPFWFRNPDGTHVGRVMSVVQDRLCLGMAATNDVRHRLDPFTTSARCGACDVSGGPDFA